MMYRKYFRVRDLHSVFGLTAGNTFVQIDYQLNEVAFRVDGAYFSKFRLWELCNGRVPGAEEITASEFQEIAEAVRKVQEARTKAS